MVYTRALFSLDSLGGGFVVQSLLALWLFQRFGLSVATAGAIFFWTGVCSAGSYLAAVPLAKRFGLVNTMVYTHLPSNVLLLLGPAQPGRCGQSAALRLSLGTVDFRLAIGCRRLTERHLRRALAGDVRDGQTTGGDMMLLVLVVLDVGRHAAGCSAGVGAGCPGVVVASRVWPDSTRTGRRTGAPSAAARAYRSALQTTVRQQA
jgi:hypothetical protein